MLKPKLMSGVGAKNLIIKRIGDPAIAGRRGRSMKLSYRLAVALLGLSWDEIGQLSVDMGRDGLEAINKHGLFGFRVDIDYQQQGEKVEFYT